MLFRSVTPEGVTYSGFTAIQTEPLLAALNSCAPRPASAAGVTVFAIGQALAIPPGLAVGLERARE